MITLTSLKGTNTFTLYLAKFPTRREGRSSIYKRRQHDHLFISLKYPMCEYTLLDSTTMARLAAYTRPNGAMHRWSLSERMWSHIVKRYFWRWWKVVPSWRVRFGVSPSSDFEYSLNSLNPGGKGGGCVFSRWMLFSCQWRGNWFVVGPTWSPMKSPVAVLDQINELICDPVAGAERRTTLAQTWELEEPWQTRSYLGLHQRGKWTSRWTRQCSIIRSCFPSPQAARCLSSFKTNNKSSRGAQPSQQWLRSTFGCSYYLEAMWKQNKYHLVGSWPASGCIWYVSGGRTRISNPLQVLIQMVTGLQIWIIWYIQ